MFYTELDSAKYSPSNIFVTGNSGTKKNNTGSLLNERGGRSDYRCYISIQVQVQVELQVGVGVRREG